MNNILDINENRKKCQHFTPLKMVGEMLKLLTYENEIFESTILEYSFGNGIILKQIIFKFIECCEKKKIKKEKIAKLLSNKIYGVELDKNLYSKVLFEINNICLEHGIMGVDWKLFNEDFLRWDVYLKFDYIIGNPPYISYRDLDVDTREFIKNNFISCKKGKPDYCYAFIEKCSKLLNEKGKMVHLVPSNLYKNVFAEELRNILLKNISTIYDFPSQKLFSKALTTSSIFLYDKSKEASKINYTNFTSFEEIQLNKKDLQRKWTFNNSSLNKSNNKIRFGDVFTASVTIATLYNAAYIVSINDAENLNLELDILKDAFSPKGIRMKKKEKIIFPYLFENDELTRITPVDFDLNYPNIVGYLDKYRVKLANRKSDASAMWYEYGRSQALRNMNKCKLIMSTLITNKVEVHRLRKIDIPYSGIYIISKGYSNFNLDYAKKILESDDFFRYAMNIGICVSGYSVRITCKDINNYEF